MGETSLTPGFLPRDAKSGILSVGLREVDTRVEGVVGKVVDFAVVVVVVFLVVAIVNNFFVGNKYLVTVIKGFIVVVSCFVEAAVGLCRSLDVAALG